MTDQSRAEAYKALDTLARWVDEPEDPRPLEKDIKAVRDAIDAAVDESYQAGYNDGREYEQEQNRDEWDGVYDDEPRKDAGTASALLIKGNHGHTGRGTWKAEL